MKHKFWKFVLFGVIFSLTVLLNFASAETIEGKILMWNTGEIVKGSVLEVYKDSSLISKNVCENGTYNLNIPQGNYYFIAFYIDGEGNKYVRKENITIIHYSESQTFDFILLPYSSFFEIGYEIQEFELNFSESDKKSDDTENKSNDIGKNENKEENLMIRIIIAIVAIIMTIFAVFGIGKFWKFNKKDMRKRETEANNISVKTEVDKNAEIKVNETKEPKINHDVEKERSEGNVGYKKDEIKTKEILDKLEMTKGMKDIMGTLTQNELSVVEILIKYNKTLTRAEISRGTGISRSSLSAALTRLEQGNIVEVDRTYMMHSVKLSNWFKSLK